MYCPKCGVKANNQDKFCGKCGCPLGTTSQANVENDNSIVLSSVHIDQSNKNAAYIQIGGVIENRAIKEYILRNMSNHETIIATVIGLGGDYLLVTNHKIVIIKVGIATWVTGSIGLKAKSHMIGKINSIDIAKRIMTCDLEIVSGGMISKKKGGFLDAAESEDIFQFEKGYYDEVTILVNRIREMISQLANMPNSGQMFDIPDQIKKLAELLEQGILTQEEFDAKKTVLLNKL